MAENPVLRGIDPARFEVVKNALLSAAEEMKIVLAKTAYSPLLKVAGDYSCGVFNARGEMVAQGPDLPIHLGSMPDAVRSVLVVDDNVDAAESLAILLELAGHEVRTAHSGGEALGILRAWAPQVALLDIGLPDLDGYELAKRLRGLPGGERMLLVALTGWGQDEDRRRAAEAGFDRHLTKPVDPDRIAELLAQDCDASR